VLSAGDVQVAPLSGGTLLDVAGFDRRQHHLALCGDLIVLAPTRGRDASTVLGDQRVRCSRAADPHRSTVVAFGTEAIEGRLRMASSTRSHAVLKVLLGIMAVLIILSGLAVLFATSWILSLGAMRGLFGGSAVGLVFKFVGALALGLGYLLYQAARDPLRYVAVIDVVAFLLIVGAIIDVYAALTHALGPPFPPGLIWGRAIFRLAIAVLVIAWRPRQGLTRERRTDRSIEIEPVYSGRT